jgi:hypothetical protein
MGSSEEREDEAKSFECIAQCAQFVVKRENGPSGLPGIANPDHSIWILDDFSSVGGTALLAHVLSDQNP